MVLLANETSCNENVSAITLQLRDEIANVLNEETKQVECRNYIV